jgi:hypothetical protein
MEPIAQILLWFTIILTIIVLLWIRYDRSNGYEKRIPFLLDYIKWVIPSVCIVLITLIIDKGFQDRELTIKEMEHYNKFVEQIVDTSGFGTNRAKKKQIADFFSRVALTDRFKNGWKEYNTYLEDGAAKKDSQEIEGKPIEKMIHDMENKLADSKDTNSIKKYQKTLDSLKYQLGKLSPASPLIQITFRNTFTTIKKLIDPETDLDEWRIEKKKFWQYYLNDMIGYEDEYVESAMVSFGEILDAINKDIEKRNEQSKWKNKSPKSRFPMSLKEGEQETNEGLIKNLEKYASHVRKAMLNQTERDPY